MGGLTLEAALLEGHFRLLPCFIFIRTRVLFIRNTAPALQHKIVPQQSLFVDDSWIWTRTTELKPLKPLFAKTWNARLGTRVYSNLQLPIFLQRKATKYLKRPVTMERDQAEIVTNCHGAKAKPQLSADEDQIPRSKESKLRVKGDN